YPHGALPRARAAWLALPAAPAKDRSTYRAASDVGDAVIFYAMTESRLWDRARARRAARPASAEVVR
ncbi:MAG: hypothetical protein JNL38_22455, partial [Myxococcales bacterium]|nr:hypothetical protein [Myxococcales bacterium]